MVAQGSSRKKAEAAFQAQRVTAHMASEVIANARTVQSFCAEDKESVRYEKGLLEHEVLEKEYRVFTGVAHLFFNAVNLGLSAGGLYFGSSLVKQGVTTPELMMEFMQV
jgi:ABC-type bacteriocin/lantibiotic exporter with double-glycine peptidase domain